MLEETHWLDLKRELGSGNAANKDLAKDIAAFALDGGTILIGLDEDTSPPGLWPVPVDGLAERIEQIARMRVDEVVQIRTTVINSTSDPTLGYVVVHVPQSIRAPHMVDGRYSESSTWQETVLQLVHSATDAQNLTYASTLAHGQRFRPTPWRRRTHHWHVRRATILGQRPRRRDRLHRIRATRSGIGASRDHTIVHQRVPCPARRHRRTSYSRR